MMGSSSSTVCLIGTSFMHIHGVYWRRNRSESDMCYMTMRSSAKTTSRNVTKKTTYGTIPAGPFILAAVKSSSIRKCLHTKFNHIDQSTCLKSFLALKWDSAQASLYGKPRAEFNINEQFDSNSLDAVCDFWQFLYECPTRPSVHENSLYYMADFVDPKYRGFKVNRPRSKWNLTAHRLKVVQLSRFFFVHRPKPLICSTHSSFVVPISRPSMQSQSSHRSMTINFTRKKKRVSVFGMGFH